MKKFNGDAIRSIHFPRPPLKPATSRRRGAIAFDWLLATFLGLVLVGAFGASEARANYFVNAFASSPLATYLFGNYSQSTAAGATSATYYTNGVQVYSAEGQAVANLGTGQLQAEAQENYGYSGACSNCDSSAFILGNANFGDSLTFVGSFSGQTVAFQMAVNGTWTTNCAAACDGPGSATAQLLVMPSGAISANSVNEFALFGSSSPYYNPIDVGPDATLPLTIDATAVLNGVNPTIDIAADLDLFGVTPTVGDSFDGDLTAQVSFTAPSDVLRVVSESGVFPGTVAGAVPEPSTWLCLALGVVAMGFIPMARRKWRLQALQPQS